MSLFVSRCEVTLYFVYKGTAAGPGTPNETNVSFTIQRMQRVLTTNTERKGPRQMLRRDSMDESPPLALNPPTDCG